LNFIIFLPLFVLLLSSINLGGKTSFDKALLSIFDETSIHEVIPKQHWKADISYLFADIKYRDGQLKICELNEGRNAGAALSEVVYAEKTISIPTPYWHLFWLYIDQLKMPVWYIGSNPETSRQQKHGLSLKQETAWETFIDIGGHYFSELKELTKDPLFLTCKNSTTPLIADDIASYKGIIVYRYRNDLYMNRKKEFASFKQQHPEFLYLDQASLKYTSSKQVFSDLFKNNQFLSAFRPKCSTYKKIYTPTLADEIKKELGCNIFVIKPLNSGRSNGIIMVEKQDLDAALKRILNVKQKVKSSINKLSYKPGKTQTFEYWEGDCNTEFIVEEYCPSKQISINNKHYDPTMRIVFVMRYDKGKIYTTILGGYWKIPMVDLHGNGSLTSKHKTIPSNKDSSTGIKIAPDDLLYVKNLLHNALPNIYVKMLQDYPAKNRTSNYEEIICSRYNTA